MVALLIAAAGFGGVFMALVQSQKATVRAAQADRELTLARQLVEEAGLGLLPYELMVISGERGTERWAGERDGLTWVVTVRSVATPPTHDGREPGDPPRSEDDAYYILMEIVKAEVGAVTLRTVKW